MGVGPGLAGSAGVSPVKVQEALAHGGGSGIPLQKGVVPALEIRQI